MTAYYVWSTVFTAQVNAEKLFLTASTYKALLMFADHLLLLNEPLITTILRDPVMCL